MEQLIFENDPTESDSPESQVENTISKLSKEVSEGRMDILESAKHMNSLTKEVLTRVANGIAKSRECETDDLPFALFVYGSPARNLMLPNSDLDVAMVFEEDHSSELESELRSQFEKLPFDKIDIASWTSVSDMLEVNNPSVIERNKAIDAKFVVGKRLICDRVETEVKGQDSLREKERRLITEYDLLHRYDYHSKRTVHGPNLKYDFGASRDIAFLDWYYLLENPQRDPDDSTPFFVEGLSKLHEKGLINEVFRERISRDVELILLVKFVLLQKGRREQDISFLHSSDSNISTAYKEAPRAFERLGIDDADLLIASYADAKGDLHGLVENIFTNVSLRHPDLLEVRRIAEDPHATPDQVRNIIEPLSWHVMVPLAARTKSSQILSLIVDACNGKKGYEYILRMVSGNIHKDADVDSKLIASNLPDRFKSKLRKNQ